jgi:hypothetical protein
MSMIQNIDILRKHVWGWRFKQSKDINRTGNEKQS